MGVLAAASVASAGYAIYSGEKARTAQHTAMDEAKANATATATAAEQATNKANQKKPDSGALLAANAAAGQSGQSSTMLTGPTGIDPGLLTLGKSTLLGGGGT